MSSQGGGQCSHQVQPEGILQYTLKEIIINQFSSKLNFNSQVNLNHLKLYLKQTYRLFHDASNTFGKMCSKNMFVHFRNMLNEVCFYHVSTTKITATVLVYGKHNERRGEGGGGE